MIFHVPYVPSPIPVVRAMLRLAGAGPRDIVYDLGCGDGRILIIAVKEFNVRKAVGIESDYERFLTCLRNIAENGIGGRAIVYNQDMFEADISDATIITLFLLNSVNEMLKPKFERELKPGTRIVSHEFQIPGWRIEKSITVRDDNDLTHNVYLYIIGRHTSQRQPYAR
jgi:precorrin-6B methylase 2